MFELYDEVKIKAYGIVGVIIDIAKKKDDQNLYVVEASEPGYDKKASYNILYPLYDCLEAEIEKL